MQPSEIQPASPPVSTEQQLRRAGFHFINCHVMALSSEDTQSIRRTYDRKNKEALRQALTGQLRALAVEGRDSKGRLIERRGRREAFQEKVETMELHHRVPVSLLPVQRLPARRATLAEAVKWWRANASNKGNLAAIDHEMHGLVHDFIDDQLNDLGARQTSNHPIVKIRLPMKQGSVWINDPKYYRPQSQQRSSLQPVRTTPTVLGAAMISAGL